MERTGGVHAGVLAPFALGAGLLLYLAFEPVAFGPAALVAIGVLLVVVRHARGPWAGALLGALFGLGIVGIGITWQLLLRPEAYFGLLVAELPFYAALGAGLHVVRGWRAAPVWSAAVWTTVETAFSSQPFGGFPWFRIGHARVNSPLSGLLPLVGTAGLTFAAVLATAGVVQHRWWRLVWVPVLAAALASGAWLPAATASGEVNVGWVQGGVRSFGVYGLGEPRTTSYAHAAAVDQLMGQVEAGLLPRPDVVVGPENTTDMDPGYDATTLGLVERMVARAGVPVLVGTPLVGPREDTRRTTAVWWTADGPGEFYDKRNLVPMGEWIPFREVFLPLVPALAYVGAQSLPGTEPGAVGVTLPAGTPLTMGVAICYDIAYPDAFRAMVDAGAQVLVVQSNNAMFVPSPQLRQQFDITRARAAEVGRPVLVVTVSGTSGLIDARGRTVWVAAEGEPAVGVEPMALLSGRTPYVAGGWLVEPLLAWGTIAGLLGAGVRHRMGNNGRVPARDAGETES